MGLSNKFAYQSPTQHVKLVNKMIAEMRLEKYWDECRNLSTNFAKCKQCEWRYKCWTRKPNGSLITSVETGRIKNG